MRRTILAAALLIGASLPAFAQINIGAPPVAPAAGPGSGDVVGPASATNNSIAAFDGTTGKLIKDGGILTSAIVTLTGAQALTNKTYAGTSLVLGGETLGSNALAVRGLALINNNAGALAAPPSGVVLHLRNADASGTTILLDAIGAAPGYRGRRANGTAGALTAVTAGQTLGGMTAFGYGDTGYSSTNRGSFDIAAAGTWTDASHPTFLAGYTTPAGSTTPVERWRTFDSGNFAIGAAPTDTGQKLQVNGATLLNGTVGMGSGLLSAAYAASVKSASGVLGSIIMANNDYVNGTTGSGFSIYYGAASGNTNTIFAPFINGGGNAAALTMAATATTFSGTVDATGYSASGAVGISKVCIASGATLTFTNGLLTSTAVC